MAQELSHYIEDTSAFLRDGSLIFTSRTQMVRWINRARREAAKFTGCIRCLVAGTAPAGNNAQPGLMIPSAGVPSLDNQNSFTTIAGVEMYPFEYARPFLQAQNAGVNRVIDVLDVSVSWGSTRPTLNWMPWGDLQALARSYNVGVASYPFAWACNSDADRGRVWLFPVPTVGGTAGEMEWDCICTPLDLNTDDDFDAIPESFHDAIAHRAAALGFMASQRFADANLQTEAFLNSLGITRASAKRGAVQDYYWSVDLP